MEKHKHLILGFGFLVCLVPLYLAKAQADKMRDNVHKLQADIAKEKKQIRTLRAEIAWLGGFARIENSARNELGMKPLDGSKVKTFEEIDQIAPLPVAQTESQNGINNGGGDIAKP